MSRQFSLLLAVMLSCAAGSSPAGTKGTPGAGDKKPGSDIERNGSFCEDVNVKAGGVVRYKIQCKGDSCTLALSPQMGALKLRISVEKSGTLIKDENADAAKASFLLKWTGDVAATYHITIASTDKRSDVCTILYGDGSKVMLDVQGEVAVGGTALHPVYLHAGMRYKISVVPRSPNYDEYLWLLNSADKVVAENDEGFGPSGAPFSRVWYTPDKSNTYKVKVGSFAGASGGKYQLTVRY